ncbi:hypothetical protein QJN61_24890, partial [Escherichia coli]|uniref:hypothetical protein n=1 Tax=Escherichia coli TaxID=562 RepID=UPI003004F4C8
VTALLADGDGIAFDVQSLTEDYDIGFRHTFFFQAETNVVIFSKTLHVESNTVTALLADGDGIAFDVQSLTEDYDIGFRHTFFFQAETNVVIF